MKERAKALAKAKALKMAKSKFAAMIKNKKGSENHSNSTIKHE